MALIDPVIAIIETQANTAGIEKAQAGFAGLNLSTLALGAALGGLILVGKAAIDNTEAQSKAHLDLQQAAAASKENYGQLQSAFDQWAETNKRYIPDQYAAEGALAAFVRAGASAPDALQELNDALDLSTIRSIDLGSAQQSITLALAGNSKGLKVLGITTEEYNAIMKDKTLTTEQKHADLLALIESKTKDGRKAQSDLTQSTQAMNKDWQDVTTRIGPPLLQLITWIVGKVDDLITGLDNLGHNKDWNKALSGGLGDLQNILIDVVKGFETVVGDVQWLIQEGGKVGNAFSALGGGIRGITGTRAGGGSVSAGNSYLVGERGPELFTPGASGSITPNGGGGTTINLTIQGGMFMDHGPTLDAITNAILRGARYRPGT